MDGMAFKSEHVQNKCLSYHANTGNVDMQDCLDDDDAHQQWYFEDDTLKTKQDANLCLEFDAGSRNILMNHCAGSENQNFFFETALANLNHEEANEEIVATVAR